MRNQQVYKMALTALLCAIGIAIPIVSPFKIVMEPASFTLGSHIAIFIAMFISPTVAVSVCLGTTAGFFLGGFPIVVVLRAATHIVFAFIGSMILRKNTSIMKSIIKSQIFSFGIGIIHALCEVLVVTPFFFGEGMSQGYYAKGFLVSVIMLVGVGTVAHSMVDFAISFSIWKLLKTNIPALRYGK